MLGKNKSNSTPRRSARLSKGKGATSTPFTTPPVNLAASASKSTGQRPPLAPKTRSNNKKRSTPSPCLQPSLASPSKKPRTNSPSPKQSPPPRQSPVLAPLSKKPRANTPSPKQSPALASSSSSSSNKRRTYARASKQPSALRSPPQRWRFKHTPREMEVNKKIRAAILDSNTQTILKLTTEDKRKKNVKLEHYAPSKVSYLGMPIEYCVDYHGCHSVPPDLRNSFNLVRELCLARVPAEYLENENLAPLSMKGELLKYLRKTFDMPFKKLSAIIESISAVDLADAARAKIESISDAEIDATARARVPTVAAPDASLSAAHAAASPSIKSIEDNLAVAVSVVATTAQNQAKCQERQDKTDGMVASLAHSLAGTRTLLDGAIQNQANLAQNLAGTRTLLDGTIQNQAKFQATSEAAISGLTQRTSKLEDDSTEMKQEISNLKKEMAITQSAQKQYDELAARANAAAAISMGGRALFSSESPSFSPVAFQSPTSFRSPMASRLRPVQENNASTDELYKFEDIAQNRGDNYLINRCKELAADSSSLLAEHRSMFLKWYEDEFGKKQRIETVVELKVPLYDVRNVSDLANLESVRELWDSLDGYEAIAKVGPSTFIMAQESDLHCNNPFINSKILPHLYGCMMEYAVTVEYTDRFCNLVVITPCPEEAKDALGALLKLASRTNKMISIQPGYTNTNKEAGKHQLCLPEMQMEKPLQELELLGCELPESTATGLSSVARKLVLDSTKVEAGCVPLLFQATGNDDRALETIEIGTDTSIPGNQLLEYMRSNDLWKFSLKKDVWNELPEVVREEFKKKIINAFKAGSNLGFMIDCEDVLDGPLEAAKEDLVRALPANHPSIQKMLQQGAAGLPFKVDKSKPMILNKDLKEWVQKHFPHQA